MILTKVISTVVQKGSLIVKILGFGSSDVRTAFNVLPFGIDSNMNKNYRAIYADTEDNDKKVLLGIINKNVLTSPGEIRLFAENSAGTEVFSLHLKNNGNCELGGNSDNLVRYSELETAYNELNDKYNDAVEKINAIINTLQTWTPVPNDGGAALQAAAQSLQDASESTGDITGAKIDNLLTS